MYIMYSAYLCLRLLFSPPLCTLLLPPDRFFSHAHASVACCRHCFLLQHPEFNLGHLSDHRDGTPQCACYVPNRCLFDDRSPPLENSSAVSSSEGWTSEDPSPSISSC